MIKLSIYDPKLSQEISIIIIKLSSLLSTFIEAIYSLLKLKDQHEKTYKEITELCVSASPYIVHEVNKHIFKTLPSHHNYQ